MLRVVYVACDQELRIVSAVVRARDLADEVVILDRGSEDATVHLGQHAGATVIDLSPEADATGVAAALLALDEHDRTLIIDLDEFWKLRDLPSAVARAQNGHDAHIVFKPWSHHAKMLDIDPEEQDEPPDRWAFHEADISAMALTAEGLTALAALSPEDSPSDLPEHLALRVIELEDQVVHRRQESLTSASRFAQLFHWMLASRHPLITFGLPGFVLFFLGLQLARTVVGEFESLDSVSLGVALATFAVTLIGVFAMMSALILYVLGKQIDKLPVYGVSGPQR